MTSAATFTSVGSAILRNKFNRRRTPLYLELFITSKCNLRCGYCFSVNDKLPREIMSAAYSKEKIFEIIEEFYNMGTRIISLLGGEPLLHKDIGAVIKHIRAKNMYLTVFTNGIFIADHIEELRDVNALAVSLDGIGEDNDILRGQGSYEKAIAGVRAATAAGIRTRIHSVLNRRTLVSYRKMIELARDLGIVISLSPPNFLGETDVDDIRISDQEYKEFYRSLLAMKKSGLPIANSAAAIQRCIDWPTSHHRYIAKGETFPDYKPEFCFCGHDYVALGAGGNMYNCIGLGYTNGPNIHDLGIRGAWEKLLDYRPDCVSCASLSLIEASMLTHMRLETIFTGLRFHLKGL